MGQFGSKIKEALVSTLPITLIVYLVSLLPWFSFSGVELISFTIGAVLLILGIGLFTLGADIAMTPMGVHVGSGLASQKKLSLLLIVCFVLGVLITVAEPDLQVLAKQVSSVMNGTVLVVVVGIGVGLFFDRIHFANCFQTPPGYDLDAVLHAAVCPRTPACRK